MGNFSILTNSGAASAVLNLSKTMQAQSQVQDRMNTGLKIGSAKDDSSTFAIAMGMRSDVAGYKKVKENLATGASTVAVASSAADAIAKEISSIKEKVTQAKGQATGREALQAAISNSVEQIKSYTAAAQINGVNLIDGSNNGDSYQVTSGLNRGADGSLSLATIDVKHQDLSVSAKGGLSALANLDVSKGGLVKGESTASVKGYTPNTFTIDLNGAGGSTKAASDTALTAGDSVNFKVDGNDVSVKIGSIADVAAGTADVTAGSSDELAAFINNKYGDKMMAAVGTTGNLVMTGRSGTTFGNPSVGSAFNNADDTPNSAATGTGGTATAIANQEGFAVAKFGGSGAPNVKTGDTLSFKVDGKDYSYTFTDQDNGSALSTSAMLTRIGSAVGNGVQVGWDASTNSLKVSGTNNSTENVTDLKMNLANVDTGEADFDALLKNIDSAESHVKDVVGNLGASENRISSQSNFMDSLIKAVNDGIGTLVDADMAEESARFTALQTQQQLGVQALSIANSAPQSLLSLFRG